MEKCRKSVTQMIPSGYGYKEVLGRCGTTGYNGDLLMCDSCLEKYEKEYPQGWREVPGDVCIHGTYVGNWSGPDYMCGQCETEGDLEYED